MSYGAAAAGGAVAAAAIARAIKASGAIVSVEPHDFTTILSRIDKPLVVLAENRIFRVTYQYLTGYRGLIFFTKSYKPVQIPGNVELILAKKIWIPG